MVRTIINTFFRWCTSEGYTEKNPCESIRPIKYNKKERGSLSEYEVELMRNGCKTKRDIAMFEVMFSTGCRVSELTKIKIDDIDFDRGELTVFGKGEKYRTCYLNSKANISVRNYLSERDDDCKYLFVTERKKDGNLHPIFYCCSSCFSGS